MCQLNLYIVSKKMKRESVLEIMKNCFSYQKPECMTDENLLMEVQDFYDVYISAGMGCNCGTIQTRFQNEERFSSWNEIKQDMIKEEAEKMLKIKQMLEREDYLEYKNEVQTTLKNYDDKIKDLKGEEKDKFSKERYDYFRENLLLYEAMLKYEKLKEENGNVVVYHTIDDDLKDVENRLCRSVESDFEDIKLFVDNILKEVDEVKFLSFWQDGNNPYVKNEKYVFRKDLIIEDFIFLKDNELLTVFVD